MSVTDTQVNNFINSYRKMGYKDYEIINMMKERKDKIGDAYRQVVKHGYENQFFAQFKLDPNVPMLDKAKSVAESAFVGTGKVWSGVVEGALWLDDKKAGLINKGVSAITGKGAKVLNENKADNYRKSVDDVIAQKDQRRKEVGRDGVDFVETGTNIVSSLPKYVLGGGAGAGAKLTTRMGEQALRGAFDGATQHASNGKERAVNMAVGGAFGALGEPISAGLGGITKKAYNAVKGNKTAHATQMEALGKKHGVTLTAGDISKSSAIRNAEIATEKIPFVGMSGTRQTQQNQARQSALNIQANFEKALSETDFKALNQIQAKAKQGNAKAKQVLDKAQNAQTPDEILQASLEVRAWREKEIARKMYDNVQKELDKLPDTAIAPSKTRAMIEEELAKQKMAFGQKRNQAYIDELQGFLDDFDNPNIPNDFANMRSMRSELGQMAENHAVSTNTQNKKASTFYSNLRQAVEKDISDFVESSSNPTIKTAYKKADGFYRSIMQRQEKAHAKAMATSTPDQIYQTFIKKGQGDKADNFYHALDAKGQSAVRYKMIEEAIEKAYDPNLGENGVFSPAKFVGEFDRLAKPYEKVFKGADKDEMDGFLKLMSHVERAGQFAENPANGSRLADYAIVGGTALAPLAMAKVGVATAMAKTLFTSKAGKRLLLAAKELPPNAKGFDNILQIAQKMLGVAGANLAVQTAGNLQDPPAKPNDEHEAMPDDYPLWDDDDWQDDEFLANQANQGVQGQNMPTHNPIPMPSFTAPQISDYLPSDFGSFGQMGQGGQGQAMSEPQGEQGAFDPMGGQADEMGQTGGDMGQNGGDFDPVAAIGDGLASLIPPPKNLDNMGNYERYVQSAVGKIMQTPQMGFILDQLQGDNPDFARVEKAQMSLSHTPEWKNFVKNLPDDVRRKVDGANILALLTNSQIHGNSELFNPTF